MNQTQNVENENQRNTLNTMSNQNESVAPLSVYIPRVFNNISAQRIAEVFQNLGLGRVHHVDFVPRVDDNEAKMAFVHFEYWNTNNVACQHLIERIQDPEREARVVYEDPYYWLLLPNHNDSTSSMYNAYNMRREINGLNNTIQRLRREFSNVNNVLETLLADFYDIPQRENEESGNEVSQAATATPSSSFLPSSNFDRLRQEQSEELVCPVCSLMLPSHATQCPACQAPLNADEKLLKVLTTKPEDTSPKGIEAARTNALNKINDFVESENINREDPDDKPSNPESESRGWGASWFSN